MSLKQVLIIGWQYLRAFALLYLCLIIGNMISTLLPFAIPGSIVGMLILFALLALQLVLPLGTTGMYSAIKKYDVIVCPYWRRHHELLWPSEPTNCSDFSCLFYKYFCRYGGRGIQLTLYSS